MRLAIKQNNCPVNEKCSICNIYPKKDIPYELFDDDSNKRVCLDCGKKHDPVMTQFLENYYRESKKLKEELLREYSIKEPKKYFQIDIWPNNMTDGIVTAGENGLGCTGAVVYELRHSDNPLRVYIHESADLEDVLKGFDSAKEWIQKTYDNKQNLFEEYSSTERNYEKHLENQNIDTSF